MAFHILQRPLLVDLGLCHSLVCFADCLGEMVWLERQQTHHYHSKHKLPKSQVVNVPHLVRLLHRLHRRSPPPNLKHRPAWAFVKLLHHRSHPDHKCQSRLPIELCISNRCNYLPSASIFVLSSY